MIISPQAVEGSLTIRELILEGIVHEMATLLGWGEGNFPMCPKSG